MYLMAKFIFAWEKSLIILELFYADFKFMTKQINILIKHTEYQLNKGNVSSENKANIRKC